MPENSRETITVVAGVPRSGTSMMMRMLAVGGIEPLVDDVRESDVDNPNGYYEYEPVKRTRDDASWVVEARGRAVKLAHALVPSLPATETYAIVLMRRDLGEVVASQRRMLERLGRDGATLTDAQLVAAFERQLASVEAWMTAQPNVAHVVVDYNALLADPGAELDAVNALLGARLDVEAMRAVVDPSLYRQRRERDERVS